VIRAEPFRLPRGLAAAALAAIAVLAYLPVLRAGFVWDDDSLVTGNVLLRSAAGLRQIWFSTVPSDYWPVTLTTFWAEWHLWGLHAAGYHAVNLALHVGESLLLWAVLRRWSIPGAWLGAMLFAVHPVNVESVAWIAERKNLLAMLFYLASLHWFAEGKKGYALSLAAFVLAMLSKGSAAILPLVLLGLLAWRRPLGKSDLLRLLPFFAVAALLTAVNIWFQGHYLGAAGPIRAAGPAARLAGAGAVVWFYLSKALWPLRLAFVYPPWRIEPSHPIWWLPDLAALGLTALLASRRRLRPVLGAWLYYGVALVPVLGLTDVYFMKYSLVADHYQHLALIGVTALAGAGWSAWRARTRAADAAAAALVAALAFLTWRQAETYRDSETLFRASLACSPDSWMARNNLGNLLAASGRNGEALEQYQAAARLAPRAAEIAGNLGDAWLKAGRPEAALAEFQRSVALDPDYAPARTNLGQLLLAQGHPGQAVPQFEAAWRLRPRDPEAEYNLALALAHAGRPHEAASHFAGTLRLAPGFPGAERSWADALAADSRYAEAAGHYAAALRQRPGDADGRANWAVALARSGRVDEARFQLAQAEGARPAYAPAHAEVGFALARAGRLADAAAQYERAIDADPNDPGLRYPLSLLLRSLGRTAEADAQLQAARRPSAGR
jgi:tetratricopeptide (TPR) repeat protein